MNTRDLAKIDLNLLISLQVLLEEENVSRAAERLFITQPAMSKTLSRLRVLFDDPLFTRSSHGMQATPRAKELAGDLAGILGNISQLVSSPEFDPSNCNDEINLALSEYVGVALLPGLTRRLQSMAPRLGVRVITRVENQLDELARGKLDFAIHIEQANYGPEYQVERLGSSALGILVRNSHPLTHGPVTLERLADYPLIRLYISDWEQLEMERTSAAYSKLLEHQHGTLETTHLLTALEVLRGTDYFMPGPPYIAQNEGTTAGITALPLPDGDDQTLNYALVAHNRTAKSPLHQWLWEQIRCTIREMRGSLSRPGKIRQRITAHSTTS